MLETTDLLHIAWFLLLVFVVHHAVPAGFLAAGVLDEAVGLELPEDAVDGGLGEMGPFHDFDGWEFGIAGYEPIDFLVWKKFVINDTIMTNFHIPTDKKHYFCHAND